MFLVRFLVLLLLCANCARAAEAVDGAFSLGAAPQLNTPIPLRGTWHFFPDRWINPDELPTTEADARSIPVPGSWQLNQGRRTAAHTIGTYWLQLRIDRPVTQPLSLRFERSASATCRSRSGHRYGRRRQSAFRRE